MHTFNCVNISIYVDFHSRNAVECGTHHSTSGVSHNRICDCFLIQLTRAPVLFWNVLYNDLRMLRLMKINLLSHIGTSIFSLLRAHSSLLTSVLTTRIRFDHRCKICLAYYVGIYIRIRPLS